MCQQEKSFHQEFFHLPKGATLQKCLFTTMSMDAASMIRMCALCLRPCKAKIGETELRAIALDAKDKLVFCYDNKHNGTKFSPFTKDFTNAKLLNAFTQLAVGITGFQAPFFHPKIILLHYTMPSPQGNAPEDKFRLLVSSKNLTIAQVFETGVWLESTPTTDQTPTNHNLGAFLAFLKNQQPKATNAVLETFAAYQNWDKIAFVLPDAQDDRASAVEVCFSGLADLKTKQASLQQALHKDSNNVNRKRAPKGRANKRHTFASRRVPNAKATTSRMQNHRTRRHLPRVPSAKVCAAAYSAIRQKNRMVILSPDYETPPKSIAQYQIFKPKNLPTHAKLYYHPIKKRLWLGSSNCSTGGMEKNIECMVQLQNVQGITPVDPKNNTVTVFGIPCERVTQSTMVFDDNEKILQTFINSHEFTITYSLAIHIKTDGTTSTQLNAQLEVSPPPPKLANPPKNPPAIELLPAGFPETNTDEITSKWEIYNTVSGFQNPYNGNTSETKFIGTSSTLKTGWLRLKLGDVECQICCDPSIGQTAMENLSEQVWTNFAYRAWYDEFMATPTVTDAKELLEEARNSATLVQAQFKGDANRCAEQAKILDCAQYYFNVRAKR